MRRGDRRKGVHDAGSPRHAAGQGTERAARRRTEHHARGARHTRIAVLKRRRMEIALRLLASDRAPVMALIHSDKTRPTQRIPTAWCVLL